MNYLIKGGYLILPEADGIEVKKQDLYVVDGKVRYSAGAGKIDREINCENKIIMPGLVNGHHHIYSTLSKGIPCKVPFVDFLGNLQNLWWTLDRALDEESVLLSTVLTMEDCLKQGVTTVFDHHISASYIKGSLGKMAEVFKAYGVQGVLAFEMSDRNGEEAFEESLAENLDFTRSHKWKSVQGMLGLHASFTLSDRSMQQIAESSGDIPIHIHVSEDILDMKETLDKYNLFIVDRLHDFGLLRANSLLVHCSNLIKSDWKKLQDYKVWIVQAVDSNQNNGLNVANIHDLTLRGIRATVGTDGMSSNIMKSYKNSYIFCKYLNSSADIGYPEMSGLLENSYALKAAYGYDLGLRENDNADLAVFDYEPMTAFDEDSFLGHFIFGITESRAQYVLKGSELLLDNYQVTKNPYAELKSSQLEISKRLFKRFIELKENN
ncbi:MAG: amidohydrolase family protein [Candidatus Cloacimonetes bacterium]|nr:amidohydrolase family protein [Candidatus Cloacimonadota bacterium]